MSENTAKMPHYWARRLDQDGRFHPPPGEDLTALRRGLSCGPGESPGMWTYYTTLTPGGVVTDRLSAEHAALALYGLHQQGESRSMHDPGPGQAIDKKGRQGKGLGAALRELRASGRYSEAAVDARVQRLATSSDLAELTHHLRSMIAMLKSLPLTPALDYDQLVTDLRDWQHDDRIGRVRRRWGSDYVGRPKAEAGPSPTAGPSATADPSIEAAVPTPDKAMTTNRKARS